MSRVWQPGDVAMVELPQGGERPSVLVGHDPSARCWHSTYDNGDLRCLASDAVAARPLAVIDPEDRERVERLLSAYLDHGFRSTPKDAPIRTTGIDYLQAALREFADPKPPKPAEPTGLGAVVEVHGRRWVYTGDRDAGGQWWYSGSSVGRWNEFDSAVTLADGWQS